jgi:hypothetical protein
MMKAPLFSPSSRSTWAPRRRRALSIARRTLTNVQFHPPPLPHPGVQQGRTDQPSDGKRARHSSGHAHIRLSHAQGSGPRRFKSQFQRTAGCLQDLTLAEGRASVEGGGIKGTTDRERSTGLSSRPDKRPTGPWGRESARCTLESLRRGGGSRRPCGRTAAPWLFPCLCLCCRKTCCC